MARLRVLFAGPVVMVICCLAGMVVGYASFIAACVIVPIVAIALGVAVKRLTDSVTTGMLAAVLGALPGIAAAHSYHLIAELENGSFTRGVALADLPSLARVDRLTLRDGVAEYTLGKTVFETSTYPAPNSVGKNHITVECQVYPIVPAGYQRGTPVRVWRFGDSDTGTRDLPHLVFQRGAPDELCRRAIRETHTPTAADAIYLEALVDESDDTGENQRVGWFAVGFLGALWLVVALFYVVRDAIRRN